MELTLVERRTLRDCGYRRELEGLYSSGWNVIRVGNGDGLLGAFVLYHKAKPDAILLKAVMVDMAYERIEFGKALAATNHCELKGISLGPERDLVSILGEARLV